MPNVSFKFDFCVRFEAMEGLKICNKTGVGFEFWLKNIVNDLHYIHQ